MHERIKLIAGGCCLATCAGAFAATGIERVNTPFVDKPLLPLAPLPGKAPAGPVEVQALPVAVPEPAQSWEIRATDVRLDLVLERWAKAAGWRVQWDANRHVELSGPNTFKGAFRDVVGDVLATPGIKFSDYPLEGCIYPNVPPLIRITRMGDQANECPQEYK